MINKRIHTEFPFWSLSLPDIFQKTDSCENGLTNEEVFRRLRLVPADCFLAEGNQLDINEASLPIRSTQNVYVD